MYSLAGDCPGSAPGEAARKWPRALLDLVVVLQGYGARRAVARENHGGFGRRPRLNTRRVWQRTNVRTRDRQ